ncbi:MAG: M14 family metallopeptidase [Acidobacteriota bacterium]|nr:M14 family metallopeptidase [Acidobacteriota bacterium]
MTRSRRLSSLALALAAVLITASALAAQTPPDKFLGFPVGADKKLADYGQIKAYFEKLDAESPMLKLFTIGETTLKKPMIMAAISTEANLAKLDRWREIARRLRDPRLTPAEDAKALAKEGKAIVLVSCSQHATEIGACQAAMELAYNLIAGKTPYDAKSILSDVVLLLVPSANPDGTQMVVDWYKKYVGTKFETGSMPWLYHYYAGHDNNRDWYMLNLKETRAMTEVLYRDWLPQIHMDQHQQGSNGARLFIPPMMDPPLPNIQPLVWRTQNLLGTSMAYDLQQAGKSGIVNGRSYTAWYIGAGDDTPWLHNVTGILSEAASVQMATPVYIEPSEIPKSYVDKMMDFVDPWPGGWWRLRDIVDYEVIMTESLLKAAARYKEDLLLNFYRMSRDAVEKTDKNQPYAYIIPARQHDYPTTLRMLDILMRGGVEIQRAKADFMVGNRIYAAGSFVVLMAQPYKPYAWALLQHQKYPDIRQYPGGPPQPPYDNAGWTLPLQMGVTCEEIKEPFEAKLEKLDSIPYPKAPAGQGQGAYVVLDSRLNVSASVVFALLKDAKAEAWRTKAKAAKKGLEIPAGSFIVRNSPEVKQALPALLEKYRLAVLDLPDVDGLAKAGLKFHRVGLYQSWRGNADEGWTRYMLDDLAVPYKTLHNEGLKGTKEKKPDLRADYDVIVFADENTTVIKTGQRGGMPGGAPGGMGAPGGPSRPPVSTTPPEYEGGIGQEGIDALRAFVEKGGIVVTLNGACDLAISEFGAPARNGLSGIDRAKFFCPTSILRILVDNETPIGYGMPKEAAAMFVNSLALDTSNPPFDWDRKVVATYPEDEILLSGWLLGEDNLARKACVVDTKYKDGRFILIGIRSQSRAQSHGTYKFLLNALLYPEAN